MSPDGREWRKAKAERMPRFVLKDKFTIRGLVYSTIGTLGIGYELLFRNPPELITILLYLAIVGIGIIAIFFMHDPKL